MSSRMMCQRLCFRYMDSTIPLLPSVIRNFNLLAIFCECTARFVSDLVGNPNCWFSHAPAHFICGYAGTILHELGHAVGFYHEQNRGDRDEYIKVNLENVKPGHEHNFGIFPSLNNVTYDYNSVMHYGRTVNMTHWI